MCGLGPGFPGLLWQTYENIHNMKKCVGWTRISWTTVTDVWVIHNMEKCVGWDQDFLDYCGRRMRTYITWRNVWVGPGFPGLLWQTYESYITWRNVWVGPGFPGLLWQTYENIHNMKKCVGWTRISWTTVTDVWVIHNMEKCVGWTRISWTTVADVWVHT